MDASIEQGSVVRINPGCFSRARVENEAGEVEVRLSRYGNWMIHIRGAGESDWRIACNGDLESGVLAGEAMRRDLDTFVFGPLVIHRSGHRVFVRDREVALSAKEFQLLLMLSTDPYRVFTKAELLKTIWGSQLERTRTLDTHASRLRRKLIAAGAQGLIVNLWATGYKLCDRVPVDPTTPTSGRSGVSDLAPAP
jgi:DNA-binding response OmpR family regulator